MAYNRLQLRNRIYGNLEMKAQRDKLAAALNSSSLTFTATTYTKYGDNVYVEFRPNTANAEIAQVNGDPTTTTITIWERGLYGTTAASHSQNDSIYINPKWFTYQLNDAINECLSGKVLKIAENTSAITITASTKIYDLPSAIKANRILKMWINNSDGTKQELIRRVRVKYGTGTGGVDQLAFLDQYTATRTVRIEYLAPFTELTDDTTACSLPDNTAAQLIPVYWACYRLIGEKESPRLQKERRNFRSSDPPLGARLSVARDWKAEFIEAVRSAGLHPNLRDHGPVVTAQTIITEY